MKADRIAGLNSRPQTRRLRELAAQRIAIENVAPEINGGRFAAKAVPGEAITIEADIFCDGHDELRAAVLYCVAGSADWAEVPMRFYDNDRWRGFLRIEEAAPYEFTIIAWRDLFATWRADVKKKLAAGHTIKVEITEGQELLRQGLNNLAVRDKADHDALAAVLETVAASSDDGARLALLLDDDVARRLLRAGPRANMTRFDRVLPIHVDRPRAAFSAWYELTPRSQSGEAERHGTFDDVIRRLPYVRELGFDVLYLTPIHPIGRINRKGPNNALEAAPGDPGSLYAIGAAEGGHDAIHPALGSFEDFDRLVSEAAAQGIEIALDFAIQCAPDHPWIKEHPEWFDWRPDGTIKFAENPPKTYEDIVNVHFYRDAFPGLWHALRDVVLFWAARRVRIFRVDNPHTKPLPFWERLIGEVQSRYPDVIFLSEAFTRPKMMKRLAKVGFTQSYTYFTWRNTKRELTEYLTELTTTECRYYMRPNFFTNTPDINPHFLQSGGRAAFRIRLVLAATLSGNYGIYCGFELCEARALPDREEYLDSEKYQIRVWDWNRPGHIRDDIALLNRLRRTHPAFRDFRNVEFYNAWNDQILYYGRRTPDCGSFVLVAVSLDPHRVQEAEIEVPLWEFDLPDKASIGVEDLVSGEVFQWRGKIQRVRLDPGVCPYAIWRLFRDWEESP